MRKYILFLMFILLIPLVLAINLQVDKSDESEVLILGLNKSSIFELQVTNLGASNSFGFYNLLGYKIFPVGTVYINSGETKKINMTLSPLKNVREKGHYKFTYYIRNSANEEQKEQLTFKIIELKEAFEIGSGEVDIDSNSIDIYVKNKENFDFGDVKIDFSSVFFEEEKTFKIAPKEKKEFTVQLNKDDFKKLMAGFYTLKAEIQTGNQKADVEGVIEFTEQDLLSTTKKDFGFLINTKVIEKKNKGNTIVESETVIKKNIISRLFTSFSPEPDIVEREGFTIYYTWSKQINPGKTLTINVKTNWLFPFILILLIVAIVILVKKYSNTHLVLKKKVSYVKAKGGEFALKVSIIVNAKEHVERVNIIDRLPSMVNVYNKFGGEEPSRIDEKTRKIEWNFEKLEKGELRVLSYVIYSKVGVMGKFALPTATAIFEREGDIHEAESNRAYFITEPKDKEED